MDDKKIPAMPEAEQRLMKNEKKSWIQSFKSGKKMGWLSVAIGFFVGIINGLLGAGGGMLVVPLLNSRGMEQKKAHASAIAVIFPLAFVSAVIYLIGGKMSFNDALPYLPAGAIGAVAGMLLLPHIPDKILRKVFAVFMLWAGFRMIKG